MAITEIKLIPGIADKKKFYAPIFTVPNTPLDVSLSIKATNDHANNVSATLVYWDNGQKVILKDYLAGGSETPFNFTINNPSSIPPYILYLDSDGLFNVDIEITADYYLNIGTPTENDDNIISPDGTALPLLNLNEIRIQSQKDVEVIKIIKSLYSTAEKTTSPLVVDLDGDGVETIGTQAGVHFDHDGNGFAENTGWVGKDDGLLARDINGNGQIDKLHLKQQEWNLNLAA